MNLDLLMIYLFFIFWVIWDFALKIGLNNGRGGLFIFLISFIYFVVCGLIYFLFNYVLL